MKVAEFRILWYPTTFGTNIVRIWCACEVLCKSDFYHLQCNHAPPIHVCHPPEHHTQEWIGLVGVLPTLAFMYPLQFFPYIYIHRAWFTKGSFKFYVGYLDIQHLTCEHDIGQSIRSSFWETLDHWNDLEKSYTIDSLFTMVAALFHLCECRNVYFHMEFKHASTNVEMTSGISQENTI